MYAITTNGLLTCTHMRRMKHVTKGRRRRYAKAIRTAMHETVITGYSLNGEALPPVWVLNRKTIDAETRSFVCVTPHDTLTL